MIVFAWDGFPQYAARCIGALVRATREPVKVIATKPFVPIAGMDELAGCEVIWIDLEDTTHLMGLVGEVPRLFIVSGWGIPVLNRLSAEARQGGSKIVGMCDNNYVLTFKEILKALRFRLLLASKFDSYFVPGKSASRLLSFYGVKKPKIAVGMYAADNALFTDGGELSKRPKKMIYVGQICERKNVLRMIRGFAAANNGDWELYLYGCGPLEESAKMLAKEVGKDKIIINPFLQPEELAAKYRESVAFCLPSVEEHWGLVVHEAALSGCVLLLSNAVGASEDLLNPGVNGFVFNPNDEIDITRAFKRVMGMTNDELANARIESLSLSAQVGISRFVDAVMSM